MDVELLTNGSVRKERQIQLQIWEVSWWVQASRPGLWEYHVVCLSQAHFCDPAETAFTTLQEPSLLGLLPSTAE